jgi:uncharacterized protein
MNDEHSIPSLNLASILHGEGGDVSGSGRVSELELITQHPDGLEPTVTVIPLLEPAQWRASVNNIGPGEFYLHGWIKGTAIMECSRCLTPTNVPVEARLESLLRYNPRVKEPRRETLDDGEDCIMFSDPSLPLTLILAEAFSFEMPLTVVHSPECKGLCNSCGANLNNVPAGTCAVLAADTPALKKQRAECPNIPKDPVESSSNPFAKLKGLLEN